ncbi:MAG: lysozyme inhibitor LprI family protein [Paracoccaceae bacterium]
MRALALVAAVVASPALAEAPYDQFMGGIPACLEEDKQECIGDAAAACFEGAPDGQTTVGMMFCMLAERDAWDALLNAEYGLARAEAQNFDNADRANAPQFAVRADQLRDAQRAWIAFRDAECTMRYGMWGSGSMRQLAGANCHMSLTAERTFALRRVRSELLGE